MFNLNNYRMIYHKGSIMFSKNTKLLQSENQKLKAKIVLLESKVTFLKGENSVYKSEESKIRDIVEENKLKNALTQNLTNGCIDNIGFVQKEIEDNVNAIFNNDAIIEMADGLRNNAQDLNESVVSISEAINSIKDISKWHSEEGKKLFSHTPSYSQINKPHSEVHDSAIAALACVKTGVCLQDINVVIEHFNKAEEASKELFNIIDNMMSEAKQ